MKQSEVLKFIYDDVKEIKEDLKEMGKNVAKMNGSVRVHEERINRMGKVMWAVGGIFATIITGIVINLITLIR